jgi:serpin B
MGGTAASDQFASSVNKAGLEIASSLVADTKSNILLSPPGIYSSLKLLEMGASLQTKTELSSFLGGMASEILTPSQQTIDGIDNDPNQWFLGNAIFYSRRYMLVPEYEKNIKKERSTLLLPLMRTEDIAFANNWVKDATHDMIKSLLGENEVSIELLVASVNYFHGKWQAPFPAEATHIEKFYNQDKSSSDVKMMDCKGHYRYLRDQHHEIIELLYEGSRFSAVIIVPDLTIDIPKTMPNIIHLIKRFEANSHHLYGRIQLPQFSIDKEFTLKEILSDFGLRSMFSAAQADFANMFVQANGIYVDDLKHHALLEVDEEGTKAASLTKISFIGGLPEPELEFTVTVNKPFIFIVRNRQTNILHYIGVILSL